MPPQHDIEPTAAPAAGAPAASGGGGAPPAATGLALHPFRAVRYTRDGAALAAVTSPPYDVIDDDERAALAQQDEHNVVRLILPEDADGVDRYTVAAGLLRTWLDEEVLAPDTAPALYVYEERQGEHVQRGIVGAIGLARAEEKVVLPHEDTMAGPVADRLALLRATGANLEPIVLAYDGGGVTSRVVAEADRSDPVAELTTDDGVHHRLWAVTDPAVHAAVNDDLRPRRATIADGHHRYATYLQNQADRHAAGDGPGAWDSGLAFLVDTVAFGPQVHAIHRVVAGLSLDDAVAAAQADLTVRPAASADPEALLAELAAAGEGGHAFALTDGSRAVLLTAPSQDALDRALPPGRSAAWRSLDVAVAHHLLVRDLWGLEDTEAVVGYRHDAPAAIAAAAEQGGLALLLNPTPVAAVAAVAAAGERMPRKSTLFTPKPRTGLLIRPLDA